MKEKLIETESTIYLSNKDMTIFMDNLKNPPKPNKKFTEAINKYNGTKKSYPENNSGRIGK